MIHFWAHTYTHECKYCAVACGSYLFLSTLWVLGIKLNQFWWHVFLLFSQLVRPQANIWISEFHVRLFLLTLVSSSSPQWCPITNRILFIFIKANLYAKFCSYGYFLQHRINNQDIFYLHKQSGDRLSVKNTRLLIKASLSSKRELLSNCGCEEPEKSGTHE